MINIDAIDVLHDEILKTWRDRSLHIYLFTFYLQKLELTYEQSIEID